MILPSLEDIITYFSSAGVMAENIYISTNPAQVESLYQFSKNSFIKLQLLINEYLYSNNNGKVGSMSGQAMDNNLLNNLLYNSNKLNQIKNSIILVYISTLTQLRLTNELFFLANKLTETLTGSPDGGGNSLSTNFIQNNLNNPINSYNYSSINLFNKMPSNNISSSSSLPPSSLSISSFSFNNFPEHIIWYCVSCYYFSHGNYNMAQKYIKKSLKKNKDFACSWMLLGHILSFQEEGEQALSVYRTTVRLLPSHFLPLLCIGKEFIRTNNQWLAAHTLQTALSHANKLDNKSSLSLTQNLDTIRASLYNELGVVFMKLGKIEESLTYLEKGLEIIVNEDKNNRQCSCITELFFNYATVLRKMNRLDDALLWYNRCLSLSPLKSLTLASIAFTLHLGRKFEDAITYYQQALSLDPKLTFASDMLQQVMNDMKMYEEVTSN